MTRNTSPANPRSDEGTRSPPVKEHAFSHAVSRDIRFCYDLSAAPHNQKLTLLTVYGIAVQGDITGDPKKDADIMAWYPLPDRDKDEEERLKKEGKLPWTKLVTNWR
jgi:hypothetical protein